LPILHAMPSYRIREALDATEQERAAALMQAVYVGEGWTAAEPAQRVMKPEHLSTSGVVLVAEREGELLGAVLFLHAQSPMRQIAQEGEREFRLLAVADTARGQGVGQALVRACVRQAEEADASALVLWTQPRMLAAQRLYERLGFARNPARDVADPRGFTRLVYVLSLR
jgi:GNAT superfamily N-acetyltransferase